MGGVAHGFDQRAGIPSIYSWLAQKMGWLDENFEHSWEELWDFEKDKEQINRIADRFFNEYQFAEPERQLGVVPFASHGSRDDFAGFLVTADGEIDGRVIIFHLSFSSVQRLYDSMPQFEIFDSFGGWMIYSLLPNIERNNSLTPTRHDRVRSSKHMSYTLRHCPDSIAAELDENGWMNIDQLIFLSRLSGFYLDRELIDEIVRTCNKQRFYLDIKNNRIRASQGHSINVDVELKKVTPPQWLFHGTSEKSLEEIRKNGINSMQRQYVHLSCDRPSAKKVGERHGTPTVLKIDAQSMVEDGMQFFLSENGVYLVDHVPVKYMIVEN